MNPVRRTSRKEQTRLFAVTDICLARHLEMISGSIDSMSLPSFIKYLGNAVSAPSGVLVARGMRVDLLLPPPLAAFHHRVTLTRS